MPAISNPLNTITSIPLTDQGSAPATPPSGKTMIFTKSDGLYVKDDAGTVTGPMAAGFSNPMTTAGDIIVGGVSGAPARLAMGAASKVLAVNSGGTALEWATASAGSLNDYICIIDKKSQNTSGGTFTSGAWRTRDLNTEQSDTGGHASIASNQITLAAGTYIIHATAPAEECNRHQAILYNVTDADTTITGTSKYAYTTGRGNNESIIAGKFTIATSKVFEIRHQCETTSADAGFGVAANLADEIYTVVELWKVA